MGKSHGISTPKLILLFILKPNKNKPLKKV